MSETQLSQLLASGFSDLQALTGGFSVDYPVTPTGTTINDAYLITKEVTVVTTAGSFTLRLNPFMPIGKPYFIRNNTGSPIAVYPDGADSSINTSSIGSALTITNLSGVVIIRVSDTKFVTF